MRVRTMILGGENEVFIICAKESNRLLSLRIGELEVQESVGGTA